MNDQTGPSVEVDFETLPNIDNVRAALLEALAKTYTHRVTELTVQDYPPIGKSTITVWFDK